MSVPPNRAHPRRTANLLGFVGNAGGRPSQCRRRREESLTSPRALIKSAPRRIDQRLLTSSPTLPMAGQPHGYGLVVSLLILVVQPPAAIAASDLPPQQSAKFLGAQSCSSSSCHGGGGSSQNQYAVWSLRDFHSQRPFATLTTARSKQICDALGIKNPAENSRCTVCHAPLQTVPAERRPGVKLSEGVSCESCHGPAENWLRGHTRPDWSHENRTTAGMRDLKDLYQRANTCVACHQTVELSLLKAEHPELIFEMDGQTVSEPRHWREATNFNGGQAWLVGQAVALRELSWQMGREGTNDAKLNARWQAAKWLIQKALSIASSNSWDSSYEPVGERASAALKESNDLARTGAHRAWTADVSRKTLIALAGSSSDFRDQAIAKELQARRAAQSSR